MPTYEVNPLMFRLLFLGLAFLVLPATAAARDLGPLASVDAVAAHKDDADVVLLDIRSAIDGGDRATFEAGHIPGAVYSSYTEAGWRQDADGVPGLLPDPADLERLIGALGIDNDTHVVVVPAGKDSTDFGSAARIYWTFRVLGHDDVSILNGGYQAWIDAGNDIATGWNEPDAATFTADFRPELVAEADDVAAAREAGVQLVDNRPGAQFRGEEAHPAARAAGTIPGALNLEHSALTDEGTAFFVDDAVVRELMGQVDIASGERTITFCNTGHWAALGWFALSEVAGESDVAMYDGSMTDWANDDSRPLQAARSGLGAVIDWLFN